MKRYIVTEKQLKDLARASRLVGKAAMGCDDAKYEMREIEAETQYNETIACEVPDWATHFYADARRNDWLGGHMGIQIEEIPK